MFTSTDQKAKHHLQRFDSLAEFTDYSRSLEDHRTSRMKADKGKGPYFGAATSMAELHEMADKGMAREGITALALADEKVKAVTREMEDQQFRTIWDVSGADVDVARFLAGEPECMMDYVAAPDSAAQPVVTLVVNVAVHCGITDEAFITHGSALVALAEAIDAVGLQSEIWADFTIVNSGNTRSGRFAIRLKSGHGPLDAGALMFTLTHPAMFRGMVLNAMHAWPEQWRNDMGVGTFYGYPTRKELHMADYPEGTIYIPAIQSNREAGTFVDEALHKLGLLAD